MSERDMKLHSAGHVAVNNDTFHCRLHEEKTREGKASSPERATGIKDMDTLTDLVCWPCMRNDCLCACFDGIKQPFT
eukprot:1156903-Pelagomonas_calceolata.AAC.7